MRLVHLTASTFFGGPERQMLGLARALAGHAETSFVSFPEDGRCAQFLHEVRMNGFAATPLGCDFPHLRAAVRELTAALRALACDLLLCHGYKANLLGRVAARRAGIPAVAVSRGWTGETRRVKLYEWLDRRHLGFMDHVVCVSEGQARKVRHWCRVPENRITVIRNSARLAAFRQRDPAARAKLLGFFPDDSRVSQVILAAGRLSPEKGFGVLVDAAEAICRANPQAGVVIFGEGALRGELERRIAAINLAARVVLPGFRTDLDSLLGAADVVVLPSYTEGLPNIALEASAAGVPVVATAVGGSPEVIVDGATGILVPPGRADRIAAAVNELLGDPAMRSRYGSAGRERMLAHFTFESQALAYRKLIHSLCAAPAKAA